MNKHHINITVFFRYYYSLYIISKYKRGTDENGDFIMRESHTCGTPSHDPTVNDYEHCLEYILEDLRELRGTTYAHKYVVYQNY